MRPAKKSEKTEIDPSPLFRADKRFRKKVDLSLLYQHFHCKGGTVMLKKPLIPSVALVTLFLPLTSLTDDAVSLKTIMQGLRNNLVEISDGLLTDDFEKVSKGASAIASHPRIPAEQVQLVAAELGQEMAAFKQMDTLVHDLSLEIETAARALDHGAASSAYQRMVNGCFACHQAYKDRVAATLSAAPDP